MTPRVACEEIRRNRKFAPSLAIGTGSRRIICASTALISRIGVHCFYPLIHLHVALDLEEMITDFGVGVRICISDTKGGVKNPGVTLGDARKVDKFPVIIGIDCLEVVAQVFVDV